MTPKKASDFMYGDFVKVKPSGMIIKIAAVHYKKVAYHSTSSRLEWVRQDLLEPIPLTPEILEKNGFKLNEMESELHKVFGIKLLDYDFPTALGNHFLIKYHTEKAVAYLTDHCFISIKYVHEFQHFLRLMERKAPEVKELADNFTV